MKENLRLILKIFLIGVIIFFGFSSVLYGDVEEETKVMSPKIVVVNLGRLEENKMDGEQKLIWELGGNRRKYREEVKLKPIKAAVKVTFIRREKELFLYLISTDTYNKQIYNFTVSLKFEEGTLEVELWGIDGARAAYALEGPARSEILLPNLQGAFDLVLKKGSKTDRYQIELREEEYIYEPTEGNFSKINDSRDDNPKDGLAKIIRKKQRFLGKQRKQGK